MTNPEAFAQRRRGAAMVAAAAVALVLGTGVPAAWGAAIASSPAAAAAVPVRLAGTFSVASGGCRAGKAPSGSYVQLQIDGLPVPNLSSACGVLGAAYTPVQQGSEGLVTDSYQPDPVPTFDRAGNSLAGSIIRPVRYLTTQLGLATTCADQGRRPTASGACAPGQVGNPAPTLWAEAPGAGGCPAAASSWCLYGDLSSLSMSWAAVPIPQLLGRQLTCVEATACSDQAAVTTPDLAAVPASCQHGQGAASCSLAGTLDPDTGAYSLDIRASTPFGLLPAIGAHFVLTGIFTAGPPPLLAPGGSGVGGGGGTGGAGAASPVTGGATPGSGLGSGTGASSGVTGGGAASGGGAPGGAAQTPLVLTGDLRLADASCQNSTLSGSYFVVSNGVRAVQNTASACRNGDFTLLSPGKTGLTIGQFDPDPVPTFDGHGDSLAQAIIDPTNFGGHKLGMATSPDDVQDAPLGPPIYAPPSALVEGQTLLVDLRSLEVSYNGLPGSSCASGFGRGCWEEGVRAAVGTFDPATQDWTLDWQASQAFTGQSATVTFHLEGHFDGQTKVAPAGTGEGWLPEQYVIVGGSTQTSGPGGAPSGPVSPGDASSRTAPGAGGSSAKTGASHPDDTGNGASTGGVISGRVPSGAPIPAWLKWAIGLVGLIVLVAACGLVGATARRIPYFHRVKGNP